MLLPPAELSITRSPKAAFTARQHHAKAKVHEKHSNDSASPFLRSLHQLVARWHKERGEGNVSEPGQWAQTGRDPLEQATALNELTLLLARNTEYGRADLVSKLALELIPNSPALWRLRIAVSQGNPTIIEQASEACPSDPEIWLASLTLEYATLGAGPWATDAITRATTSDLFPPGALVRAGDFLWRHRMTKAADMAARYAMPRSRGLLPAFVLGLRCSIALNDLESALSCAMRGAEHALDLMPFYRTIVTCKILLDKVDRDLLTTMEQLHSEFPEEARWPEQLAELYFQRGDTRSVLSVLTPILEQSRLQLQVSTLLFAAEAARLENKNDRALGALENAYKSNPDNAAVLNNLVYSLASGPDTLARARELLPSLLSKTANSAAVLDTAAFVHLAAQDFERADRYIRKALKLVKKGDYAWPEIHLHAAEINYCLGAYREALKYLDLVFADPRRTPLCDVRARELLALSKARITKSP
jgi:tetratricopeptide (TPR) repeat protein